MVRRSSSAVVLALHGELDMYTKGALTRKVDSVLSEVAPHPPGVIVDLSGLAFCDSSGLSALIGAQQRTVAAGRPLALAGAGDMVERILSQTGLDQAFPC